MKYFIPGILICLAILSANAQMDTTGRGYNGSKKYNGSTAQDGAATQAPDAFFAGFGTGALDNLGANDLSYQMIAGRIWNAGALFGIKALAEVTTDFDNAILASALIGSNFYPVKRSNFAPYIGAAGGIGYANGSGPNDALGFDLSSTIGFLIFRTSPISVKLEGNANFLFREFTADGGMPMTFTGRLALLF